MVSLVILYVCMPVGAVRSVIPDPGPDAGPDTDPDADAVHAGGDIYSVPTHNMLWLLELL